MKRLLSLVVLMLATAIAQAASTCEVTLAWDPSPNDTVNGGVINTNAGPVTGYRIYWGPSSGQWPNVKDVGLTLTNTVTGLPVGVTNYFIVRSYNVDIESDPSNQVSYRCPFPKPLPPGRNRALSGMVAVQMRFENLRIVGDDVHLPEVTASFKPDPGEKAGL